MQAVAVRLRGVINPEPISPAGMTSRYGFLAAHAVALNYAIAGHWQREGPGMGEPIWQLPVCPGHRRKGL